MKEFATLHSPLFDDLQRVVDPLTDRILEIFRSIAEADVESIT
jgi:hypothetical protein